MKLADIRFAIVEDRDDAMEDLLVVIKGAGLSLGHCVGKWTDFDSARAGLDAKWRDIDILFLDLNIPLNASDSKPTKDHGRTMLDYIINDLNRRGPHKMSVVIVSGEVHENYERELWLGNYKAIVVGLAMKGQLTTTLPGMLQSYCDDPYTAQLRSCWPGAETLFQTILDENETAQKRLLDCQTLASLMLKNIAQFERKLPDQSSIAGLQLKDLLTDYLVRNFKPTDPAKPWSVYSSLKQLKVPTDSWILRGYIFEYLSTINSFRNSFIHQSDTGPFHDGSGAYGIWSESTDEIRRLEEGQRMCQMLVLLIKDVLDWYLPWHRKVYLPWIKSLSAVKPPTK